MFKNKFYNFLLAASFIIIFQNRVYSADFENPHGLNSGNILSANVLNEIFDNIANSKRAVTEDDLVGEWSCISYLVGDNTINYVSGWEESADGLYHSLDNVSLVFSDDGDGTYSLASNSPNPISPSNTAQINSSYKIIADVISFVFLDGSNIVPYELKRISETRIILEPSSYDYYAALICDLQNLPPENPKQLSATLSGSTVSLTWSDESDDEDNFKILRRDSLTGEFAEIGTSTSASYTDTLTADGKYWYRVVAVNENGDSLGSNVVKVTLGDEDDTQSLKNELRMMRERMQLIEDELGESGGRP